MVVFEHRFRENRFRISSWYFYAHALKLHFSDVLSSHSIFISRRESQLAQYGCEFAALTMGAKKRKSGAGAGEKSGKASKLSPEQIEAFPHVPKVVQWLLVAIFLWIVWCKFDEKIIRNSTFELAMSNCESMQLVSQVRLHDVVFPAGGPDKYLTQKYPDQALSQRKFQVKAPNWTGPRWHNWFFRDPKFGQAAKLDFASWIHRFIPPDPRLLQRKNDSWF